MPDTNTTAALGSEFKSSGVTENTPKNILFGAGTIHKGLAFSNGAWNFASSLVGATSGGSKFEISPDIQHVEVDGVLVSAKGLAVKQGETASMEINFIELTPEIIKASLIGQDGTSTITGYSLIESKSQIETGDYWDNVAFVGKTLTGVPIIVILDNALCTSGLSIEGKNKEAGIGKYTFECTQDLTEDLSVLPYHIYYPTPA